MDTFTTALGNFLLSRFPVKANDQFRAWDAADDHIVAHLTETNLLAMHTQPLILNDSFGALTVALANYQPQMQSDSYLAHQGTQLNLQKNGINPSQITLLTSLERPQKPFNIVIIKIPKSLAMLEDQLYRLKPLLRANTYVLGAAMAKHIHRSTLKIFETLIGKTSTSLARKKARLIFCQNDLSLIAKPNPYPKTYTLEDTSINLHNHANVFSQNSLDIGSHFFLTHLPEYKMPKIIVDLGCGNGVIGLVAALKNPQAELVFVDESYMAIASARINFKHAFPDRSARFITTDCLSGIDHNSIDIILNNPPFHQQHIVGDHIAWQMFKGSLKALKPNGELWVIGNRHLNYHIKLKRLFGKCETIASNDKFVISKATKC